MRARVLVIGVLLVGGAAAMAVAQGSPRWVERTKADVRTGRGSFYEIVDTVLKGEKVDVLGSEARWQQVQTPRGRKGWVFEAALSAKAVEPGASDFLKLAPSDASTSATAASAGAKGVYAQVYARERGYDYGVVTFIESSQPPASEIEEFVRDGGLVLPGGGR
ncbi:MAG TPA: hypothetical protein DCQ64_28300 [Candidatus Rokubacteria bacterium]|nr:hypothetical protein [Candidatus Rokubacteria bacterium]